MRLEARGAVSRVALVAAPFAAIAFTLLASGLFVAWAGAPLGRTYALIFEGGFGSRFAWSETLTRATPLILTGLAAAVAFRAHFYNIGAEGQLYAGALAAVAVGGLADGSGWAASPALLFPAMIAAAMAAGALLLLVPALLRTRLSVDEVVTTLLLNFIVLLFVSMMLEGPMKDPAAMGWPQSVALADDMQLGKLIPRTRLHTGLLWAVLLAGMLWALLRYTTFGFAVRAVGANARAAAFAGVPVTRTTLAVALLSGALAGLAGALAAPVRSLTPGMGFSVLIESFIVTVIGGMGSILGALVGALLIGLIRSFGSLGFPLFTEGLMYLFMVIVLVSRPSGLFGKEVA